MRATLGDPCSGLEIESDGWNIGYKCITASRHHGGFSSGFVSQACMAKKVQG